MSSAYLGRDARARSGECFLLACSVARDHMNHTIDLKSMVLELQPTHAKALEAYHRLSVEGS